MSKDPAILFYTGDFLTGCADLNLEERGQYITLLCLQHQKGHLSEKMIKLAVGETSSDVMRKFKTDDDGNFYNERMDIEINKRVKHSEKQRKKIQDYWDRKRLSESESDTTVYTTEDTTVVPLENRNENEDEDRIDYKSVVKNFETLCPNLGKVQAISEKRKAHIRARVGEFGIDKLIEAFRLVGDSDFLNGKNDRAWKADIDWVINPNNFIKIIEGRYNNKKTEKYEFTDADFK
jgi:uncharacterized protein YdaU (DUF1376 family)